MQKEHILFDGFKIIQDDNYLKLTQDTALLSDFAKVKKGERVFDIGVGVGSLSLLLLVKNPGIYTNGIEILPGAAEIAKENFRINGFENVADVKVGDLKDIRDTGDDKYEVCVSNPPYFDKSRGKTSKNDTVAASRAEENSDIFDVVKAAKCVLKWGGRLYFCYKPERIESAMKALFQNNFAVKRMQFVHQKLGKPANLVMIEARFGGGEWMDIEPPVIIEE